MQFATRDSNSYAWVCLDIERIYHKVLVRASIGFLILLLGNTQASFIAHWEI